MGGAGDVADAGKIEHGGATGRVGASELDALASDLSSGKLTPHEAIDRLVAQAGAGLPATEQAELRELLVDLVANDPYLSGLAGRV